jgi:outer membrane protein TolC
MVERQNRTAVPRAASLALPARVSRTCLAAAAAAVWIAGCNVQQPPPFDPRAMQQTERSAATEVPPREKRALPTTLESEFVSDNGRARDGRAPRTIPAPTTGPALVLDPIVRLPLPEIIQRAVTNNLDVRVAGFGPAIEATRGIEAEARFDPTFFSNFQFENRDRATAFTTTINDQQARVYTFQTGVRQNLPSGGQAELRYELNRTKINASGSFSPVNPNPFYSSDLILQVTQPLLRDFGNSINRARLVISRNNQRISLLDFRKQLEETTAQIEQTYWQLVQAEREVRIAEDLLGQTIGTADILIKRRGQDVTAVQINQANASVETRRSVLISARSRVRDLSDQLKRLMNDPSLPVSSNTLILPATPPVEEPIRFDLEDQINTAMEFRFELGQQQLRVSSAEIAQEVAKNNLLPQLNIVGSVSISGLGNDIDTAFTDQDDFGNISYTIGLQFEIPIGNRAARATWRRALLQRQQAVVQYQNLIDQIAFEVKTGLREVDTRWDQMIALRQARFAQEGALRAIEQRETAGEPLTPTFVQLKLDTQERVANARSQEVEAISNYNFGLAQLEQRKGTLLRYNNIMMEERPEKLTQVWK